MSGDRQRVTIDGEWLLNRLEAVERAVNDIRGAIAQGGDQPHARVASPAGINIRALDWKVKHGAPAREDDPWAWAFAYTKEGVLLDAARQLVQEIERYDKVEVSGYEITLSGRDKNLLSRTKKGSQRR